MSRVVKAALLYFCAVFGTGFALGVLRVLWVAPQIGARSAELLELPFMLAVAFVAARAIVRRTQLAPAVAPRLSMGVIALALMLGCEFSLVLWLRGISLRSYFVNMDPIAGASYYGALAIFAALPLFMPPRITHPRRAALASAAAALTLASLVIYGNFRHDLGIERARVAVGSAIAETACGPIEYAQVGEGPAVLLVHGAGGGYDQTVEMAQELAATGMRAITMSRFGYLRTPLPFDASPAAQADAHACLLDALKVERAAIMGISAGAPSSMQFALRHPERSSALILLVPLAYAPREAPPPLSPMARLMIEKAVKSDFLYWAAMTIYPDVILETILGTPRAALASASVDERARVRRMMQHILPLRARQQGLLNEATVAMSLPRYWLEGIDAPTLIVSVEDDLYGTYASAKYTAAHIRNGRFVGYKSGGHLLAGHNEEVMAQVVAFLGGSSAVGMAR